jgi:hypothetical protein
MSGHATRTANRSEGRAIIACATHEDDVVLRHNVVGQLDEVAHVLMCRSLSIAHVDDVAAPLHSLDACPDEAYTSLHRVQSCVSDLKRDDLRSRGHPIAILLARFAVAAGVSAAASGGVVGSNDTRYVGAVCTRIRDHGQDGAIVEDIHSVSHT